MADLPNSQDNRLGYVRKDLVLCSTFVFLMLVLLGPLFGTGFDPDAISTAQTGQGSVVRQACYLLVAFTLFCALKPWENYTRVLAIPLPLFIGLAYCWLSLIWAIEPSIALRRLILTTLIMWMLFASMRQLKFEEGVTLLRISMLLILIGNYAAVMVAPEIGIHGGSHFDEYSLAGDWRGVLVHKNFAGAACALTAILYAFDRGKMPRWLQIAVLAAALFFLYKSNSKTSFGLGIAALCIGVIFLRYKLRYKPLVIVSVALLTIAATVLSAVYQNPLLGKLDDPKAFTGRTQIWNGLLGYIADHPLLGSGYGSFWDIGPDAPIFDYANRDVVAAPTGHNGFLDLTAMLGIPGLVVIIVVAIILPFRKLLDSPLFAGSRGALLIALFLFCVGHNFTESSLFDRDLLVWVMLMMAIALSQPSLINYRRAKFDVHELFRITPPRSGDRQRSRRPSDASNVGREDQSPTI